MYLESQVQEFIKDILEIWNETPDDDFPKKVKERAGKDLFGKTGEKEDE